MHNWMYWTGLDGTGPVYAFTSGPGPFLEGITIVGTVWHVLNCHEAGCWRPGRYHDPVSRARLCGHHHHAPRR
jgi:hypothetical protein